MSTTKSQAYLWSTRKSELFYSTDMNLQSIHTTNHHKWQLDHSYMSSSKTQYVDELQSTKILSKVPANVLHSYIILHLILR